MNIELQVIPIFIKVGKFQNVLLVSSFQQKPNIFFKDSALPSKKVGAMFVEMGFYVDISRESSSNIEINVWARFYKILKYLIHPKSKGCLERLKLPKNW